MGEVEYQTVLLPACRQAGVKNSALLSGKKILYWNELSILPYNDPGESF